MYVRSVRAWCHGTSSSAGRVLSGRGRMAPRAGSNGSRADHLDTLEIRATGASRANSAPGRRIRTCACGCQMARRRPAEFVPAGPAQRDRWRRPARLPVPHAAGSRSQTPAGTPDRRPSASRRGPAGTSARRASPCQAVTARPDPIRTGDRFCQAGVYSRSRGSPVQPRSRPARPVQPAVRDWFRDAFEAPTRRPGPRLGRDRPRRAHADPRADRQRQDPRRVPVVPRPPRPGTGPAGADRCRRGRPAGPRDCGTPAAQRRGSGLGPHPVRVPAQGARLRRGAQPPGAAGRASRWPPRAWGSPSARSRSPSRTGDTPGGRAPPTSRSTAGHPDHDARVALPAPHAARRARSSGASSTSSSTRSTPSPGTKRGAHLALSLERLERLRAPGARRQRIGLSATQRPLETIGRFLGGVGRRAASVTIVDAGARKPLDLQVVVPVEDMSAPRRGAAARGAAGRPGRRRRVGAPASGRRSTRGSWS